MNNQEVHIEEMVLRLPGVDENMAFEIVREITRQVSEQLPDSGKSRQTGSINLRLQVASGTPENEMVQLITSALLKILV